MPANVSTFTAEENAAHLATLKKAAESSDVARLLLRYITDEKFARGLNNMVYEKVQQIERA